MNEAETRADLIDPALAAAGWGVVDGSRTRREVIAPGRLTGSGKRSAAAATLLAGAGFPHIVNMLGGALAWQGAAG